MKQRPQPSEETLWLKSADKAGGAMAAAEDEEAVDDPLGDPLGESDDAVAQGWACNKCAYREGCISDRESSHLIEGISLWDTY